MPTRRTIENLIYRQLVRNICRRHLTLEGVAEATERTFQTLSRIS